MYTGTLIDELIRAVERAEDRAQEADSSTEIQHWSTAQDQALRGEAKLGGVA
jgi:predicted amidohydrolase YtcJ